MPKPNFPKALDVDKRANIQVIAQEARNLASTYLSRKRSAGIAIGLLKDGESVEVCLGLANLTDGTPITSRTLFEIGSVSKALTGLLLADAVTRERVSLNTSLNQYLPSTVPELLLSGSPVTFGHLVTHRSGLPKLAPGQMGLSKIWGMLLGENPYAGYSDETLLSALTRASKKLKDVDTYSNFGYSVLAFLLPRLERVRIAFADIQKHLTDQLGMKSTWIRLPNGESDLLAQGYMDGYERGYWFDGGIAIDGAGSTVSNLEDMMLYIGSCIEPSTQPSLERSIRESLQVQRSFTDEDSGIAYAWIHDRRRGYYWHSGATGGFSSFCAFSAADRCGVVVLSNNSVTRPVDPIGKLLLDAMITEE